MLDEINRWNEAQGTGKVRKYAKIKKKIDNIKMNGNGLFTSSNVELYCMKNIDLDREGRKLCVSLSELGSLYR